jgi:hypothetical protein
MPATSTSYAAVRIRHGSAYDFARTRARFEERVPALDPAVSAGLVIAGADWSRVRAEVEPLIGPFGLSSLARLDQGALFSLSGGPVEGTLYLVGNPLVAREIVAHVPAAVLYAPFRVAVAREAGEVHISYDRPSSVFASLGSAAVDAIAADLDARISAAAEDACR